jgi:sigma-B regulation protein RsbU (phosphoserine phosphatase)
MENRPVDYRSLFKKVETFVEEIDRHGDIAHTIHEVAQGIVTNFREELGIYGGRLYRRVGKDYTLQATFGDAKEVPEGTLVPASYPPIEKLLEGRTVFMRRNDPDVDRSLERLLGVQEFAAIEVADGQYILAFNIVPEVAEQEVLYSLGILRHAINQKVGRERLKSIFDEAKEIQASILPTRSPDYGNYDVHGRSEPMETVGGDFFDYIPITDKILGVAVADVSGHGLPAALQVRDIYTGLRMGMARDFKIVRTVERLNGIIHQSTLTSRFVSMFYGELELNGLFIYVNAGHPPPFLLRADGSKVDLEEGGLILGPVKDATYERGFVTLRPGDLVVMYTDGITETTGLPSAAEEEYGVGRLVELVRENRHRTAKEIVDEVFTDLGRFCTGCPPQDDRTVVVLRYPE